jgi:hypothetical protein
MTATQNASTEPAQRAVVYITTNGAERFHCAYENAERPTRRLAERVVWKQLTNPRVEAARVAIESRPQRRR